jgi:hypothetical protein
MAAVAAHLLFSRQPAIAKDIGADPPKGMTAGDGCTPSPAIAARAIEHGQHDQRRRGQPR